MSDSAEKWNVRFELDSGDYAFTTITRKNNPIDRSEIQEWAEAQARIRQGYYAVDEIYPVQEPGQ